MIEWASRVWRRLWKGAASKLMLLAIFAIFCMQLTIDAFSGLLGGGFVIAGDIVLGGMQVYLAYRIERLVGQPQMK